MSSTEVHHLFHSPIADHSFSSDKRTLAVARDSNVEVYYAASNKFSLSNELKGHEKTVTGVDIAPSSGRIVTCSQGIEHLHDFLICLANLADRSQCIRLGTDSCGLEANLGPPTNQPSRDLCPLVAIRAEIRRRIGCARHRRVLL